MNENTIVFIDANGVITGQIHSYDPKDEIELRRLIEDFKHNKPSLKESIGEPKAGNSEGFPSPAELRQHTVDWILKNEAQAREHAQPLKEFLDGISECATHTLTPLGEGLLISTMPATCESLCESFKQPALREYLAMNILNSAEKWFVRIKDSVLGWDFDKVLGFGGDVKRLKIKSD